MGDLPPHLAAYLRHYTEIQDLPVQDCAAHVSPSVRFIDPFSDFSGSDLLVKLLQKSKDDVRNPSFRILHAWMVEPDRKALIKWHFTGEVAIIGLLDVTGMSEIDLDNDGLVCRHQDYWDAGLDVYARIPVLGALIKRIRKKLTVC